MLQFALGGAVLFALWAWAQRSKPEPSPPVGPAISRTVIFDTRAVEGWRASFRAGMKREPLPAELADLVQEAVDEEVLFREGLARGLDRDDGVVRRRVVEKVTALIRPSAPTSDPAREELRRWYQSYRHRFVRPAWVTFDQLFFDPQRRDGPTAAVAAASAAMGALAAAAPDQAPPAGTGDRFVLPERMTDKSDVELAHLYGEAFARAVAAAPIGRWQGPLTSRYGPHLIRVRERRAERLPPFEEVEKVVRADWLTVETRGQRAAAESLLPRYEIDLPGDLRAQIADAPALAPILRRRR